MPQMAMAHEVDPKEELLTKVGDISGIDVFNNAVLVAIYVRPTKTKSGLYLTDKYTDEDRIQGKAGLVVQPQATHHARGEVLDQHVGAADEVARQRQSLLQRPHLSVELRFVHGSQQVAHARSRADAQVQQVTSEHVRPRRMMLHAERPRVG